MVSGHQGFDIWLATQQVTVFLYAAVIDKYRWGARAREICETMTLSILYLRPSCLVLRGTHAQVRTATAVDRPLPRSHAKKPSSAKVTISLIPLLTCNRYVSRKQYGDETVRFWYKQMKGRWYSCQCNFPKIYIKRKLFPSEQCRTCSVDWSNINWGVKQAWHPFLIIN